MRAANDAVADLVPVDVVINTTLAAAWHSGAQMHNRSDPRTPTHDGLHSALPRATRWTYYSFCQQAQEHHGVQLHHWGN